METGAVWRNKNLSGLAWLQRHRAVSRWRSLAGGGEVEASSLVELHVPDTTNGLDLGLEGAEVVVVSVVTALKKVLVASVSRVLVTHPPENSIEGVSQRNILFYFILLCPSI